MKFYLAFMDQSLLGGAGVQDREADGYTAVYPLLGDSRASSRFQTQWWEAAFVLVFVQRAAQKLPQVTSQRTVVDVVRQGWGHLTE